MATVITVQDAADVMATMQQLLHKAQTGKDATEEQIALRMLGSVFETPENPIMDVVTAFPEASGASAMAAGGDRLDALMDSMMDLTKPADKVVAEGKAPAPPVVSVLPKEMERNLQYYYDTLMDATSLCQLFTRMLQAKAKPNGFDITKEAGEAFAFMAKTTNEVMMGPMAGFYNFVYGSKQSYNNTIDKDKVHDNLIGKVFEPFGFDDNTKKQLDKQLTTFVGGIKSVSSQDNPTNTMDFCLLLNLCPKKNVSDDPNETERVYEPATYLVYMKIKASSFSQSVKKNTSVDKVKFEFDLVSTKCSLNTRLFEANRSKFDKIFEQLVGENLRAFTMKAAAPGQIKSNETNPGASVKFT